MMLIKRTHGLLVLLAVSMSAANCQGGSLRRSELEIQSQLLKQTPIGSSMKSVEEYLRLDDLNAKRIPIQPRERYLIDDDYPPRKPGSFTVLWVCLGRYGFLIKTDVEAFYSFDSQDRLTSIVIRKSVDSL
jgi:hypothetical protein